MANPVQIYEFSTGIQVDVDPSSPGGWVSRGFTGHYMNVTLPDGEVPHEVKRAIANKYFSVTEGGDMNQPAVIGREVQDWSVVAVVSRGRDDGGRPLSVYRYFLCEGKKNLWQILAWMEEYRRNSGQLPIFNPSEARTSGDYYIPPAGAKPPSMNFDEETTAQLKAYETTPILLPDGQNYELKVVHSYAIHRALQVGQPIAWAYNAEVLENPRSFILIHVASDRAYQRIKSLLASAPAVITPIGFDEQKIKSAIKKLRLRIKPDTVNEIAQEINNPQITPQNWHTWFDGQGAQKAIHQPIATELMARLLTLRAILIPETLPELVRWLEGHEKLQKASLDFQKQFRQYFPTDPSKSKALDQKLFDGVCTLLLEVLNKKVDPKSPPYYLKSPKSIWSSSYKQLLADLLKSLQETAQNKSPESPILQQVLQSLITYWYDISSRGKVLSRYEIVAEFFNNMSDSPREYQLAAYFYQVSTAQVETRIFKEAFNSRNISQRFQGLQIIRNVPLLERIILTTIKILKDISKGIKAILNSSIFQYAILGFVVFLAVIIGIQASLFELLLLLITKVELIYVIAFNVFIIVLAIILNLVFWQSGSPSRSIAGAIVVIILCLLSWASFLFRPTPGLTKEQFDEAVGAITNDLNAGLEDSPQFKLEKLEQETVKNEFEKVLCSDLCPDVLLKLDENNSNLWKEKLIAYQKDQGLWPHGVLTSRTREKVETQVRKNLNPEVEKLKQKAQSLKQFRKTAMEIKRFVETLESKYSHLDQVYIINQLKRSLDADENEVSKLQYAVIRNPDSPNTEQKLDWIDLIISYQQCNIQNFSGDYGVFDLSKMPELEESLERALNLS
ncbi:hypothetical protein FLX56_26045 [Synechococcus moorigangaii CMS01]|nr:hypothetical protein [Synechococcus moorigangaii CMS01]